MAKPWVLLVIPLSSNRQVMGPILNSEPKFAFCPIYPCVHVSPALVRLLPPYVLHQSIPLSKNSTQSYHQDKLTHNYGTHVDPWHWKCLICPCKEEDPRHRHCRLSSSEFCRGHTSEASVCSRYQLENVLSSGKPSQSLLLGTTSLGGTCHRWFWIWCWSSLAFPSLLPHSLTCSAIFS